MDRPMYAVIQNRKLYVLLRAPFKNGESGVVEYTLDDSGKPVDPSPVRSTKGIVACHLLVDQGDIYCANYISGSLCKLPDQVVQHQGCGLDTARQEGPHMHFVGLTPDRNYICAADLGTDTVYLYDRAWNLHSTAKVPAGHGVRHLAFSQDGKWMFAANELKSTVSVFAYTDGTLSLVDTCDALPANAEGQSAIAAIRVQDKYIYVSNRGHDSISKLSFNGQMLTLLETFFTGGKTPRDFCFVGSQMLCANQDGNTVTLLDEELGILQTVSVEMPVCVCVESQLEVTEYDGPGYKHLVDFNGWRVAVANYMPKLELTRLDFMDRHLETDEVFVLLQGEAGLLIGKERLQIPLEIGKVCNVKKGIWHRVFMTPGAKILIVENTDTGPHNTEYDRF